MFKLFENNVTSESSCAHEFITMTCKLKGLVIVMLNFLIRSENFMSISWAIFVTLTLHAMKVNVTLIFGVLEQSPANQC